MLSIFFNVFARFQQGLGKWDWGIVSKAWQNKTWY